MVIEISGFISTSLFCGISSPFSVFLLLPLFFLDFLRIFWGEIFSLCAVLFSSTSLEIIDICTSHHLEPGETSLMWCGISPPPKKKKNSTKNVTLWVLAFWIPVRTPASISHAAQGPGFHSCPSLSHNAEL